MVVDIEIINISTTGNAVDFGDLQHQLAIFLVEHQIIKWCYFGGYGTTPSECNNLIDVTIASQGNSTSRFW